MNTKGFTHALMLTPRGIEKRSISFEDGHIHLKDWNDGPALSSNFIVVPGFIDEHIHGAAGADVMNANTASLSKIAESITQEGVTSFLATTMSMDKEHIEKAVSSIAEYRKNPSKGAKLIGTHLEGPFLSPKYCGSQDPTAIRPFDKEEFDHYLDISGKSIKMVTFAIEENGEEALKYFNTLGIRASLGHSNATAKQTQAAIDAGLSCVTHMYNAMRGFTHRETGIVGTALLNDSLSCELIADLRHVPPEAISLLFRAKGSERIILISDACEGKYLPGGHYTLGGRHIVTDDGVARLEDGTIAASLLRLDDALKNIHTVLPGLHLQQLIDMVSTNPAKNLGVFNEIGSIEESKAADLVVIDRQFNVYMTIVNGVVVYKRDGFEVF